jgi:hypothetical protein
MAVTVRTPNPNNITVSQGSQTVGSVVVKKAGALTIQGLSNVDTSNLQDGYTLVYDSETNLWISQPVDAGAIASVDGGTY